MSSTNNYFYPLYEVDSVSNLKEMVDAAAEKYGERVAFVYQNQPEAALTEVSFRQYRDEVEELACGLVKALNIDTTKKEGKRIALLGPNSYNWTKAYLATVNIGQVIVPMDWQLSTPELLNLIQRAGVSSIFFSGAIDEKIRELKKELEKIKHYICLDESSEATIDFEKLTQLGRKLLKTEPKLYQEAVIYPETMCTLIFTSGTTSVPKGVMLSHKNLSSSVYGLSQLLDMNEQTILSVLPLFHSFEFAAGFLSPFHGGSTVYYLAGGIRNLEQNMKIAKPTSMFVAPLVAEVSFQRIMAQVGEKSHKEVIKFAQGYFGGRLQKMSVGGAPLNSVIADKFEEMGVKIIQGYGMSENSPTCSVNRDEKNKHASVGLPLPNILVKIDAPDETGVGEIIIRGNTVMLGYYKDERKTDEAIQNNWLHTGDYGYFDEDGFLYVTGRKKNIILGKNAKNIYPEELEFVLNNTPGIRESLVYGKITDDNDVKPAALIVPDLGGLQKLDSQLEDVDDPAQVSRAVQKQIDKINQKMAKFKCLVDFEIVDQIPRTATGKLKRTK